MDGEQPTIASEEQVTPAIPEVEETEVETPVDLQQPEGQETDEDQPEDDGLDELDFGFKKYRVPKELKTAVEEWRSSTTKKEQSVAEQTRALEASRLKQAEASDAELDARAELKGIKGQLAEYAKLSANDWAYHMQNDPLGTQQARMQYDMLRERQAQLEGVVSSATKERTEAAQQALAKRVQETFAEATKIIPGTTAETVNKSIEELVQFAHSEGIPEQVLQDNWSPQLLKLLHRARVGTLAMQKQATAAPKPANQQPTLAPLEKVAGKSTPAASKSLRDIAGSGDMEAYVAARKAGKGR